MKILIILSLSILSLLLLFIFGSRIYNHYFTKSVAGGVIDQQLSPCPQSPNCVNSFGTAPHDINPIILPQNISWEDFLKSVEKMKPISQNNSKKRNYAHFVFITPLLNYFDDAEFLYQPEKHTVQVRSASRVGHSDYGVNRKRVERIRKLIHNDY